MLCPALSPGHMPSYTSPEENIVSALSTETAFSEFAAYDIMDANVRVGPSGIHGVLAMEAAELLVEMDRFSIRRALVSHFTAEEYDVLEGNRALAREATTRLVPAWSASPDTSVVEDLRSRNPRAVRLCFSVLHHNFSPAPWCAGDLC